MLLIPSFIRNLPGIRTLYTEKADGALRSANVKKIDPGAYCHTPTNLTDSVEQVPLPELDEKLLEPEAQQPERRTVEEWEAIVGIKDKYVQEAVFDHTPITLDRFTELHKESIAFAPKEKRVVVTIDTVTDEYETQPEMHVPEIPGPPPRTLPSTGLSGTSYNEATRTLVKIAIDMNRGNRLRKHMKEASLEYRIEFAAKAYDQLRNRDGYKSVDEIMEQTNVTRYALMKVVEEHGYEKRSETAAKAREERRAKVANYLAEGLTVQEIARKEQCSTSTIYHDKCVINVENSEAREFAQLHEDIREHSKKAAIEYIVSR